jgi:cytochrome b561
MKPRRAGDGAPRKGRVMAASYLILAIVLAFTLNHRFGLVRAAGTLLAAIGLSMIVISIVVADFDGSFVAAPTDRSDHAIMNSALGRELNPIILNIQAVVATTAAIFLFRAAWLQTARRAREPVPAVNTKAAFGRVSRYAHWITATLVLCLVPMGLFVAALRGDSPDRAAFAAIHQSLGLAVIPVVVVRLLWLLVSPPPPLPRDLRPWERRLAHAVHAGLYCLILAFPLSGALMTAYRGEPIQFFSWPVPAPVAPDRQGALNWASAHDLILPFAFYAIIFAHVGAVLKHHFMDGRAGDVRRMLT